MNKADRYTRRRSVQPAAQHCAGGCRGGSDSEAGLLLVTHGHQKTSGMVYKLKHVFG